MEFFKGKTFQTTGAESVFEEQLATAIYFHLVQNGYVDEEGSVTAKYKDNKAAGTLSVPNSETLSPVIDFVWPLVDALYLDVAMIGEDARKAKKIPLNEANFAKKEFQDLWRRIDQKAVYQVEFDSQELIGKWSLR